jgi:N-acetylglucosamine-6-phosphate deacetylase
LSSRPLLTFFGLAPAVTRVAFTLRPSDSWRVSTALPADEVGLVDHCGSLQQFRTHKGIDKN